MRFTYFNFERLVLGCINSYEGVQRRIFKRFTYWMRQTNAEPSTWDKTQIFKANTKSRPRAASKTYPEPPPIRPSRRGQKQGNLVVWIRHFEGLYLYAIATDQPQNKYTISTSHAVMVFQSWAESVPISKSYDHPIFSSVKWQKKICQNKNM